MILGEKNMKKKERFLEQKKIEKHEQQKGESRQDWLISTNQTYNRN